MGCGGSKDTTAPQKRTGRETFPKSNTNDKNGGQASQPAKKGATNNKSSQKKTQQPIDEKGYKKRIRENLRHAAAGDDIEQLEKSMEIFVHNHLEDGGDYAEAERRLEFLQLRKEIRDACMRNHPKVLDSSIKKVEASKYRRQLKPYLDKAYYLKQHQDELETFRHDISNMDQCTISEIRSYHHPPLGVHETMIATYMILGYPEGHLTDWTDITALMGRYGKDSLIREVTQANQQDINNATALRARTYLGQHSLEEVRSVSSGAAAFYVWSSKMVGNPTGKKGGGTEPTRKLTNSGSRSHSQNQPVTPSTPNRINKQANQQQNKANQQAKAKANKANVNKTNENKTNANKANANKANANKANETKANNVNKSKDNKQAKANTQNVNKNAKNATSNASTKAATNKR